MFTLWRNPKRKSYCLSSYMYGFLSKLISCYSILRTNHHSYETKTTAIAMIWDLQITHNPAKPLQLTHGSLTLHSSNVATIKQGKQYLSGATHFHFRCKEFKWYKVYLLTFCWPCISVYLSQYLTNLMHKICFTISFIIIWYHHTYRCDDTRGCVMQFWPPDDEHMCSKHVEAWNKTYCETNFVHQVG